METLKFKTNIKCSGCVAKVTPHLNETVGEGNWEVDINDPSKILSIKNDQKSVTNIQEAVSKAGFKAEKI
jgi:copper chaperone